MKSTALLILTVCLAAAGPGLSANESNISGDYLEVRSCDVYTGYCVANGQMGLIGKEGILVWSVRQGAWNGTQLDGLGVIAVVRTDGTLGDLRYNPQSGKTVLIVDQKANAKQQQALADFARSMAGHLIREVVEVKAAALDLARGACDKAGCAAVKAGNLVEISTRCIGGKDHLCGNEEVYYPPLTQVNDALPAFTEVASYKGSGLNATWESTGQRSAFLATFSR
jgi:hypothetical protein